MSKLALPATLQADSKPRDNKRCRLSHRPGAGAPNPATAARALIAVVSCQAAARNQAPEPTTSMDAMTWLPVQERGFAFLLTQQADGVFSVEFGGKKFPDVGLTGIGLAALQTKPTALRDGRGEGADRKGSELAPHTAGETTARSAKPT